MNLLTKSVRYYPATGIVLLFFLPIFLGMLWAILPAFGYFPVLGFDSLGFEAWHRLFEMPGLRKSLCLTIFTGISASVISCVVALFITASFYTSGIYKVLQNTLAPLLAIPHLTIAAGIAFLLAPSGFLFRIIGELLGWDTPPNLIIVPDRYGLVLILTLCLKEIPFFLFIINGALTQINASKHILLARSMGYHPYTAWFKVILPQIYARIKLPVIIVIIFSFSVVDIAIFTAPNTPPPFAVMLLTWFYDPDLSMRLVVAAGGLLLIGIIFLSVGAWCLIEKIVAPMWEYYIIYNGRRGNYIHLTKALSYLILISSGLLALASLLMMIIWSFSLSWSFPSILPNKLVFDNWLSCQLCSATGNSLGIALLVTAFSLFVVISFLEATKSRIIQPLFFYIPLIIPQIIFLFGFDLVLIKLDIKGFWGVAWSHWLYVMPYIFLILYVPYRNFDTRYEQASYGLGKSRLKTLIRIKLPILFRPIIYAFAIGFAVSISEYLPTLIAGGGRVNTLSTEMVALASSGDRRIIGTTSTFQALLPLLVFLIAIVLPNIQARFRRGLAL